MKIFISGSIRINKIPQVAIEKINSIISKKFHILIGDANGIDSLVQRYLHNKQYRNVTVYYAGETIRNNIGNWETVQVPSDGEKGRDLYTLKDIKMTIDADHALMIWDGKSKGTFSNIIEMSNRCKRFYVVRDGVLIVDSDFKYG